MYRVIIKRFPIALLLLGPLGWVACSAADGKTKESSATAPPLVSVSPASAVEQPIAPAPTTTMRAWLGSPAPVLASDTGAILVAHGTQFRSLLHGFGHGQSGQIPIDEMLDVGLAHPRIRPGLVGRR